MIFVIDNLNIGGVGGGLHSKTNDVGDLVNAPVRAIANLFLRISEAETQPNNNLGFYVVHCRRFYLLL